MWLRVQKETPLRPVGGLGAGERAKVLVASPLARDFKVLMLDEPTNDLDIETQDVRIEPLKG